MAVKRRVIVIDDAPDNVSWTVLPPSLMPKSETPHSGKFETDIPARQEDYEQSDQSEDLAKPTSSDKVGRTFADLLFSFMYRREFVPTMLFVFAFFITVSKLQKLYDLLWPVLIGVILNLVWCFFGIIRKRTGKYAPPSA